MTKQITAPYKRFKTQNGVRFKFYCGITGALACESQEYGDENEDTLMLAWENDGRRHFEFCHKCGKWVISAAYNPEVFECTDCAPFEHETNFCKYCGARVDADLRFCPACYKKLHYEGGG